MSLNPTLHSLNQILSSDLLINSRYDIVSNFNTLNTYMTQVSAGLAQIAPEADVQNGVGIGALTPLLLKENALLFPVKENIDLMSYGTGATWAWNEADNDKLDWCVNIKYLKDNLIEYENTILDEKYLIRNGSDTPTVDDTYDLGSSTFKWANIYATNFIGTATRALYADVAEIYTCKDELEVGTLVSVATEGDYEVEASTGENDINCIGIVSEKPAFLMNSESDGVIVGLVGKVPVRVHGEIKKGDVLVPSSVKGVARAARGPNEYIYAIARAAEAKPAEAKPGVRYGTVTCIIKR